jgi:hypothetical protein
MFGALLDDEASADTLSSYSRLRSASWRATTRALTARSDKHEPDATTSERGASEQKGERRKSPARGR